MEGVPGCIADRYGSYVGECVKGMDSSFFWEVQMSQELGFDLAPVETNHTLINGCDRVCMGGG